MLLPLRAPGFSNPPDLGMLIDLPKYEGLLPLYKAFTTNFLIDLLL